MKVATPQGDLPWERLVNYQEDILNSETIKKKKQTVTHNDNKHDGKKFRELKVAIWNIRGNVEKTEELQTELHKRKTDIAIITQIKTILTRLKLLNQNLTIIGVYAPTEGKDKDTEEFYSELQNSVDKIPNKENISIAGMHTTKW